VNAVVLPAKPVVAVTTPPVAAGAAPVYYAREKVLAMWKDGKYYAALIEKVLPASKYTVTFTQYGNKATVPASHIKRK